jgi:ribosome-associated translation inhibitor RaiA
MDIPIELHNAGIDRDDHDRQLYILAEERINQLAKGHSDITKAEITLTEPTKNNHMTYIVEATVVLYIRPTNISATETAGEPKIALKGALDAVERQVHQKREKMRSY